MEVIKIIKDIQVYSSSAIKNLSSNVLKDAFLALPEQITYMYNRSLATGIFPPKWKIATVIPLQKDGDKSDVNNLRPISLLPLP